MTRHIYCAIALSLIFQSDAMAESTYQTYGKKGFDECYDKTLSGEQIVVPCPTGPQVMTTDEIQESLDQFRAFEESDLVEKVFEAARERDASLAKAPPKESPFMRQITSKEYSEEKSEKLSSDEYKSDWNRKNQEHEEYIKSQLKADRESTLDPDVKRKVRKIKNGQYLVYLTFINNRDFPWKAPRHQFFRENPSEAYYLQWQRIIFEHYLTSLYAKYQPELGAVNDVVNLKVLVTSSEELESIVLGQPIKSISHIGTPIEDKAKLLDETGHLPVQIR